MSRRENRRNKKTRQSKDSNFKLKIKNKNEARKNSLEKDCENTRLPSSPQKTNKSTTKVSDGRSKINNTKISYKDAIVKSEESTKVPNQKSESFGYMRGDHGFTESAVPRQRSPFYWSSTNMTNEKIDSQHQPSDDNRIAHSEKTEAAKITQFTKIRIHL